MFLGFLLSLQSALWAAEVRLFESQGQPVADFHERVEKLVAGDELVFSNGRRFVFESRLGQGNTTYVLSVNNGTRALRLPMVTSLERVSYGEIMPVQPAHEYLSSFLHGQRMLADAEVPVVGVFVSESDSYEYLIVEKLELKFTLEGLLGGRVADGELAARARAELVELARKTWLFAEIGDFRENQLGWVEGRGWVLFDFTESMKPYWAANQPFTNAFQKLTLPAELGTSIEQAVLEQRAKHDRRYCELLLGVAGNRKIVSAELRQKLHAFRSAHSKK